MRQGALDYDYQTFNVEARSLLDSLRFFSSFRRNSGFNDKVDQLVLAQALDVLRFDTLAPGLPGSPLALSMARTGQQHSPRKHYESLRTIQLACRCHLTRWSSRLLVRMHILLQQLGNRLPLRNDIGADRSCNHLPFVFRFLRLRVHR